MHSTWEHIPDNPKPAPPMPGARPDKVQPRNLPITERMRVPGGYLYRVRSQGSGAYAHAPQPVTMVFVPVMFLNDLPEPDTTSPVESLPYPQGPDALEDFFPPQEATPSK